jgi:hypothetical protein
LVDHVSAAHTSAVATIDIKDSRCKIRQRFCMSKEVRPSKRSQTILEEETRKQRHVSLKGNPTNQAMSIQGLQAMGTRQGM